MRFLLLALGLISVTAARSKDSAGTNKDSILRQDVPDGWVCSANYYAASDGCDCECGVPDPDCEDENAVLFNCAASELCLDGECVDGHFPTAAPIPSPTSSPISIPSEWTCEIEHYSSRDGCDCNCGAPDPDCDISDQVYNCGRGEICVDAECTPEEFDINAPRNYTYYDYIAMEAKILDLQEEFPNLIKVTTAQEEYGLPSAGQCGRSGDCKQYIVHLTNFETYEAEKATRPEVFFSGCLHGNERVGTTTMVEFMQLMAHAHTSGSNAWLKRLVDTRSIFIMPAANALGYFRNEREENGIDPNRDFAIDVEDETQCMQSITARSLNELFREHMFQLSITFHSGTRAITYEWGDVTHVEDFISPDDYSQASIASALSAFAGKFSAPSINAQSNPLFDRLTYPNGPSTPLVYAVRGGMEDWGYAASWAPNRNVCRPNTFGGYPVEKTQYSDSMFRAFNMLVESDDEKEPAESALGNNADVLKPTGEAQGHIPRHIRLALTMTEAVQPYFKFVSAISPVATSSCGAIDLETDIDESMIARDDVTGKMNILKSNPRGVVSVSYEIGGGFTVNSTKIKLFKRPPNFDVHKATFTTEDLEEMSIVGETAEQSGYTRWGGGGVFGSTESSNYQGFLDAYAEINLTSTNNIDDREQYPFIPAWKACFRTPTDVGEYLIFASATMDQNWGEIPDIAVPADIPLQAHVSQARTNSSWMMSNAGFEIKGQVEWLSRPILMQVTDKVVPTGWSCNPLYYGAHDGCDCNCGIRDPDCSDEGAQVYNCEEEQVCLETLCVFPNATNATSSPTPEPTPTPTSLPESWTCDPKFFDALDGCDCNCGAKDPDCDVINADVYNCESDEICVEDKCVSADSPTPAPIPSPTKPPVAGWTCDVLYYNASDGCDCNCGVPDPDCEDSSLDIYNCITGDLCVDGECVAVGLPTSDPTQNPTQASVPTSDPTQTSDPGQTSNPTPKPSLAPNADTPLEDPDSDNGNDLFFILLLVVVVLLMFFIGYEMAICCQKKPAQNQDYAGKLANEETKV